DYEQAAWGVDHLWTGKEYFVSSDDGSYHGVTEGTHTYCMAKARAHGVVCDSLWGYTGTGTPITTAINAGRAMLAYSGHGVETAWQGPSYNGWYVDQLTNLDKYPIVLSFACLTGNFTYSGADACFMERWIKPTGKGAVVAYGSSVSSFWYDDDYLQRRMWDALFDNGWNWMGGFTLEGKLRYKLHYGSGSGTRGYFEQYNILGDPSLLMYTLVPSPLAATFPATIPAGTPQSVAITVTRGGAPCQGALVCLYKAGEVHAAGYTDVAGQANLSIPSATAGTMEVTATAFNSIAFLDDITVGGGGDPEPPSMPAWSSLDAASGLLTWAPSTDNVGVTGYRVYRSTTPQFTPVPGLLFVTTPSTSTDVSSSLGDVSVNYNFRVTAVDAALNESVPSPTVGEHDFQLISPVLSRSSSAQLPVE
ncbi:MAG: C25 family cysteine peptidase, partial [Candidatus Eisenbacteria bacterium]|nr:C25 family cysteine peptidase [Candidatus Eisenbacteria bacterium]